MMIVCVVCVCALTLCIVVARTGGQKVVRLVMATNFFGYVVRNASTHARCPGAYCLTIQCLDVVSFGHPRTFLGEWRKYLELRQFHGLVCFMCELESGYYLKYYVKLGNYNYAFIGDRNLKKKDIERFSKIGLFLKGNLAILSLIHVCNKCMI